MSAEPVMIHQGVAGELLGEVKRLCEGIKAGDPSNSSDPSVKLGALFSEASARNGKKLDNCAVGCKRMLESKLSLVAEAPQRQPEPG